MNSIQVEIVDGEHSKSLFENFQSFALHENFTDVTLVCAHGRKVFTHKILLCTVSDIMKQIILDLPMTNEMVTVHVPDLRAATVKLVIDFLYKGAVHLSRTEYQDFQDTMGLLGIVLTAGDSGAKPPEQPPPMHQVPVVQQPVYQPGTILVPSDQNVMQTGIVNDGQPQVNQFVVLNQNQGMQYILPEQPFATNDQSTNLIPIQDTMQPIAVNSQQIAQVMPSRPTPRPQTAIRTNQSVLRARPPNTAHSVQYTPNTGQFQVVRHPQTARHQVRVNNPCQPGRSPQRILPKPNTEQAVISRAQRNTDLVTAQRRRRRTEDEQQTSGVNQAKRSRDST